MNWKEIKDKYPKAARLHFGTTMLVDGPENTRDLYDFFDENKLYCQVYFEEELNSWMQDITEEHKDGTFGGGGGGAKDRKQGEINVFVKAFEILEDKL